MATLSAADRNALSDSAFAYIDPKGGRHFPIHDKAHVIAALRLGPRSPMWAKAKGKVMAAAKKFGVGTESDTGRALESLYPEIRFYPDKVELRSVEDTIHITGYAAVFGAVSRRLGGFHEKVLPSAFNRSREDNWPNVVCRYNHKDDYVLGTTGADTCRLSVDERGLHYDVQPPTTRGDVTELVQRGDVRYSSFAFRCIDEEGDSWEKSEYNLPMRSLHSVELVDVAPVMDPAYRDTTAMARNITGAVESLARWVNEDPSEVRSILEAGQAIKFFKRTDRPSVPEVSKDAAEARACDDLAIALRRSPWTAFEERVASTENGEERSNESETPEVEENARPTEEETRAAMKNLGHDKLCKQWTDGQPCVRPIGHDADGKTGDADGHAPLCWAHKSGLPCHMPVGHDGDHEPLNVKTRDAEGEPEETRDAPEAELDLEAARAMLAKYDEPIDLGD